MLIRVFSDKREWGHTAASQEHCIDIAEVWVDLSVDYIVLGNVQFRPRYTIFLSDLVRACIQQFGEEIAIATVLLFRLADGLVAFKDRDTDG